MPHPPRPIRAFRLPAQRKPSFGQAAAAEAALDRELILHLGALPLLLPILERLGLRELVNRHCHPDGTTPGDLDVGLVTGVLVRNRLLAPQPLVHVETWLAGTALPDLWGLEAPQCNDDRLARTLDARHPHLGHGAVQALLASVPAADLTTPATALAYRPQRAAGDPAFDPYHGVQRALHLPHPDPDRPPLHVRALVVWSPGKARVDAQVRATHLERLEVALRDLAGKLGRRPYTTVAAVEKRVAILLRRHPARAYVRVVVRAGEPGPTLQGSRREDALLAAAALDGRYVLGPNDPTLTPDEQLATSKRRDVPEKRYALLKGPLAVRPVFLHQQARVLSLVCCTMVALLVFALLEWVARRAGERDSGTALLARFSELRVLVLSFRDGSRTRRVTGLDPFDAELLERLGWPPATRYNVVHP